MSEIKVLAAFCIYHGRGKVFKNRNMEAIINEIAHTAKDGGLRYCVDQKKHLGGVVLARINPVGKIVHIKEIVVIDPAALLTLLKNFITEFPGHKLTAYRRDQYVEYDTPRLVNKLAHKLYGRLSSSVLN